MVTKRYDALCATTVCATNLKCTTITADTFSGNNVKTDYLSASTALVGGLTATGVTQLSGNAIAWDDIRIAGLAMKVNASAPDLITLSGGLLVYGFDGAATDEQCYFGIQMPHNYKLGTDLNPHVHWAKSTAATGDVVWVLEYSTALCGSSFPATAVTSAIGTCDATAWLHAHTDLSSIAGSSLTATSAMLIGRLMRQQSNASDTYGADAGLLEFDIHYQVDGFGSDTEHTKSF